MRALRDMPWWTEADAAELDLLVGELVRAVAAHREHCQICMAGGLWCSGLRDALDATIQWRDLRRLRSRASWLRVEQKTSDWLLDIEMGQVAA